MLKASANATHVPKGVLTSGIENKWHHLISRYPDVKQMWHEIVKPAYNREVADARTDAEAARTATPLNADAAQDKLKGVFQDMMLRMTPEKLEALLANGAAMRVLAQIAGIDLTDKPMETVGPGAELIIVRPHPKLLDAAGEEDTTRRIAALIESHKENAGNDSREARERLEDPERAE